MYTFCKKKKNGFGMVGWLWEPNKLCLGKITAWFTISKDLTMNVQIKCRFYCLACCSLWLFQARSKGLEKEKKSALSIFFTSNPFKLVIFLNKQAREETSNPCYTYVGVAIQNCHGRITVILITSYLIWSCLLSLIDDQSLQKCGQQM